MKGLELARKYNKKGLGMCFDKDIFGYLEAAMINHENDENEMSEFQFHHSLFLTGWGRFWFNKNRPHPIVPNRLPDQRYDLFRRV